MSTGVKVLLIISGTLIILTGLFLTGLFVWAAIKISKQQERQEAEWLRREREKAKKEEETAGK